MLKQDKREEYGLEALGGVFKELERYNKEYLEYKRFIEGKIKKIIEKKGKGWSEQIKEDLQSRYREIVDARELLKREIESYRSIRKESTNQSAA